ncbi:MAG: hypothetical protein H6602_13160 [Flavobacteriales bacterium]|nr:hypothetical protein [Flavobacteriales bacterium]
MKYVTVLAIAVSLLIGSCKQKDPCEDIDCANGVCESGNCLCEPGFEGILCQTEQRLAFVGVYSVSENCDQGNFDYSITITVDSENAVELTIHNIGDFDFDVIANVNGVNLTIADQPGNGANIQGAGSLVNGMLSINYTLTTSGGQTLSCSLSGLLQ